MTKKEREEYLKLLAEHGLSEEEDDALTDMMTGLDVDFFDL